MTTNEKVFEAVLDAVEELNHQLPKGEKLEKSTDTALFGNGGTLDSLGLVSLVTTVEQNIEDNFGVTLTLLENIADLDNENPFKTVATLADYVASNLEKTAIE